MHSLFLELYYMWVSYARSLFVSHRVQNFDTNHHIILNVIPNIQKALNTAYAYSIKIILHRLIHRNCHTYTWNKVYIDSNTKHKGKRGKGIEKLIEEDWGWGNSFLLLHHTPMSSPPGVLRFLHEESTHFPSSSSQKLRKTTLYKWK